MKSHDLLSLDLIRNALSSLTQLGLIRQPERWGDSTLPLSLEPSPPPCVYSEVEGRDRLVKVDKQEKLVQLVSQLGQ